MSDEYSERSETLEIYAEAYIDQKWDRLDEVIHPDFQIYGPEMFMEVEGPLNREQYRQFASEFRAAFDDFEVPIADGVSVVHQGEKSAVRDRCTATHTGSFFGIEATGNKVDFEWPWFIIWEDGKIIEKWDNIDLFTLSQQIGTVPDDIY
ncbi:ester cyclase [Natrarchaeobius chitinivorans]|uniref:Ester cyclase n=1 Tax=Natrarchaeobius chitinivorans TaxID=1679083 RepID=A0A3N6MGA8_NATCH|nr:ester cyclase [Natrarchaeobius chitinivorans]RQG95820.1 hypothetical protein EA473_06420 [Natrarchaeobius chitinivorans]